MGPTFLKDLRKACPDAQIDLLEGNHEFRLLRHLSEATPALKAVLSDLHGLTVSKPLGLDEYEVNYIARCDLAAFSEQNMKKELARNYAVYFDSLVSHHFPNIGRKFGMPGVSRHHHKHIVWPGFSPHHGAYEYHQIGCGHKRKAIYTDGEFWGDGL